MTNPAVAQKGPHRIFKRDHDLRKGAGTEMRLAPGVLAELKKVIPKTDSGRRKAALSQGLTRNVGAYVPYKGDIWAAPRYWPEPATRKSKTGHATTGDRSQENDSR